MKVCDYNNLDNLFLSVTVLIHTYIYWPIDIIVRVFDSGPGDQGSISRSSHTKDSKWYLMPPCIIHSIIRYESSVSGVIQEKKGNSPKVAIEKGAFESPSTTVDQLIDR